MHRRTALFRVVFYWGFGWGFVVSCRFFPLTPALSPRGARGKGSRLRCFSRFEFDSGEGNRFWCSSRLELDSVLHVGVSLSNNSVGPLSLRERVRVRAVFSQ
jgi:hypothetical protein